MSVDNLTGHLLNCTAVGGFILAFTLTGVFQIYILVVSSIAATLSVIAWAIKIYKERKVMTEIMQEFNERMRADCEDEDDKNNPK